MMLEQASGPLRVIGEWLFDLVRELTGGEPQQIRSGGWYRARSDHGVFLYFRFTGARVRTYPPGSIHLVARWDDHLEGGGVTRGNNWFGSHPSADLAVRPEDPDSLAFAEQFIRRSFQLRRRGTGGRTRKAPGDAQPGGIAGESPDPVGVR